MQNCNWSMKTSEETLEDTSVCTCARNHTKKIGMYGWHPAFKSPQSDSLFFPLILMLPFLVNSFTIFFSHQCINFELLLPLHQVLVIEFYDFTSEKPLDSLFSIPFSFPWFRALLSYRIMLLTGLRISLASQGTLRTVDCVALFRIKIELSW